MASDFFDLFVILILVFFTLRGVTHGFLLEIAGIVEILAGFTAANALQPVLSQYLTFISNPTARYLTSYVFIFAAVMALVTLMVHLCRRFLEKTMTKWVDHLAGFLLGLTKGLLICSLVLYLVQSLFADAPFIQNSRTLPYLNHIIAQLRAWIPDDLVARIDALAH